MPTPVSDFTVPATFRGNTGVLLESRYDDRRRAQEPRSQWYWYSPRGLVQPDTLQIQIFYSSSGSMCIAPTTDRVRRPYPHTRPTNISPHAHRGYLDLTQGPRRRRKPVRQFACFNVSVRLSAIERGYQRGSFATAAALGGHCEKIVDKPGPSSSVSCEEAV